MSFFSGLCDYIFGTDPRWLLRLYADDIFLGLVYPDRALIKKFYLVTMIFQRLSNCKFHVGEDGKSIAQASQSILSFATSQVRIPDVAETLHTIKVVPMTEPVRYLGIWMAESLTKTVAATVGKISLACSKAANMINAFCNAQWISD